MPVWNEENVRHLLSRAGFGAESRDVKTYLKYGHVIAVEKLVTAKPSAAQGPSRSGTDPADLAALRQWWIKRMAKAKSNRLIEKMCLFWHDHFATNQTNVDNHLWVASQNKLFRLLGMGSFHTLVFEVTRDPAMLEFLDGRRNNKTKPNENYGRELQELFVLGVTDIHGIDNYTQTDVSEMARALTGFTINTTTNVGEFNPSRFDTNNKTLFAGKPYQASGNLGVVDSSGALLGPATNVIDILFSHRDSDNELTMPRFLAKKLWEWFAYPNPSIAVIDAVAAPFIAGGFIIRDLVRAIFLHEDFYSEAAKTSSVKNPVEYAISALRATRASTNALTVSDHLDAMGMLLFEPPTVNGWNPGFAWISSGLFLARLNFAQALAAGRDTSLKLRLGRSLDLSVPTAGELVDQILANLGIAARVPTGARQALVDYFAGETNFTDPTVQETKVRGAIYLALALPEASIH
jgi:uncharacterized protein (DUF1800 family)